MTARIGKTACGGFTLTEVLVGISIMLALVGVSAGVYQKAMAKGLAAREMSAGKALISSYVQAARENDGVLLPGYDRTVSQFEHKDGKLIHGLAAQRYPYRLAQYFDSSQLGPILAGNNRSQINTKDTYIVSCYPTFGINYYFVGGDISPGGKFTIPNEVATRLSQVARPSSLLVFATAGGYGQDGKVISGFCILTPPRVVHPMWSSTAYSKDAPPANYGAVHARHDDKALAVFLDGSVRSQTIEELRDMRLWSIKAAEANDPAYRVTF